MSFMGDGPGFPGSPQWNQFFQNFAEVMRAPLETPFAGRAGQFSIVGYVIPETSRVPETTFAGTLVRNGTNGNTSVSLFLNNSPGNEESGESSSEKEQKSTEEEHGVDNEGSPSNEGNTGENEVSSSKEEETNNEKMDLEEEQGTQEKGSDQPDADTASDGDSTANNDNDDSKGQKRKAEDDNEDASNTNTIPLKVSRTDLNVTEPIEQVDVVFRGVTFRFMGKTWPIQFIGKSAFLFPGEESLAGTGHGDRYVAKRNGTHWKVQLAGNSETVFEIHPRPGMELDQIKLTTNEDGIIQVLLDE